jgi:serine/threonine-protein kinase
VPVFDVGQSDGRWFIVSELVDGMDLARMLATRSTSPEEAARLVAEVAESLQYAHLDLDAII